MLLIGGEFLKLSSGLNIKCDKSKWNVGGSIAGIPQRIAAFPGADNEHDGCDALNGSCFLCVQKKGMIKPGITTARNFSLETSLIALPLCFTSCSPALLWRNLSSEKSR